MNRLLRRGIVLVGLALPAAAVLVWRMPEVAAWRMYAAAGRPVMEHAPVSAGPEVRWFDDYYVVAPLGGGAYAIGEPRYGQCNFNYLVVGSTSALLFDTGPGVRDIRPVVRSLTGLPVVAVPSHLHFDHVGGLGRFADVALLDAPALRAQVHGGRFRLGVYQFLGFIEGFERPTFTVTRWVASGTQIDLGGRKLTVLSEPGHTPDSVVLLDRQSNRLFAGDFIYPSSIYAFLPGADLAAYAASARRVAALLDDQSIVYGAHGCDRLPRVDVPALGRSDVLALEKALISASSSDTGSGWYPRQLPVNERMTLLAKYPWMRP